jgi:hypothetical protein
MRVIQRVLSLRLIPIRGKGSDRLARQMAALRLVCSSVDNSRDPHLATTFDGLIKQKFLAASREIAYHIEERSPDPTEIQLLELETRLDYSFKERDLLRLALTHKSAAAPNSSSLSWVGDSVLQLTITEQLAASEGYASAGRLTKLRAVLATREHFAECAAELRLGPLMVAGKGMVVENEMAGNKPLSMAVLGELFEAVIGAVFVDGGIEPARYAYVKNFPLEQELKRMTKIKKEEEK